MFLSAFKKLRLPPSFLFPCFFFLMRNEYIYAAALICKLDIVKKKVKIKIVKKRTTTAENHGKLKLH